MPQKCLRKSSLRPSAIAWMGMPLVLVVISVPGVRTWSTFASSCCLMSSRSITTSMIQSQSLILARSSSKFPVVIRLAKRLS